MLIKRHTRKLREWWCSPVTVRDRVTGAFIGGFAGFWMGVLGRFWLGAVPVSFSEIAAWALAIAACGVGAGIAFPKPVAVVFFPFSIFGSG